MMAKRSEARGHRALQARFEDARQEFFSLREQETEAGRIFNATMDPALLEASILELQALQVRLDALLREIKSMNGELANADRSRRLFCRGRRSVLPAVPSAENRDQAGLSY